MEVDGKRMGPFSAEQIVGLLQDKEIRPDTRVTSVALQGKWITARELAGQTPAASTPTFQPPPRPAATEASMPAKPAPTAESKPGGTDPALSLFDTLKVAKEKQAGKQVIPPPVEARARRNPLAAIPPKAWIGLVVALALATSIWAMVGYVRKKVSAIPSIATGGAPPHPAPPPIEAGNPAPPPPALPAGSAQMPHAAAVPQHLNGMALPSGSLPQAAAPPAPPQEAAQDRDWDRDREQDRDRDRERESYPAPPDYPPAAEVGVPQLAPAPPPAPPPPPPVQDPNADNGANQDNNPPPPPAPPPPPLPE